jgi:hypothetical protein
MEYRNIRMLRLSEWVDCGWRLFCNSCTPAPPELLTHERIPASLKLKYPGRSCCGEPTTR